MAHCILRVINARCVARDLHTIAPGPLERRRLETVLSAVRKRYNSRIPPFSAIFYQGDDDDDDDGVWLTWSHTSVWLLSELFFVVCLFLFVLVDGVVMEVCVCVCVCVCVW